MNTSPSIEFNVAIEEDLPKIIELLVDDSLGSTREVALEESKGKYLDAFKEISADPNNELIVGKLNGEVVAVLQMTYIPNLTLEGTKRALIEGVRVVSTLRGEGIGHKLFHFVLDRARSKGCGLAQLTTNKARLDAHRFYEKLGFKASHIGFKLQL